LQSSAWPRCGALRFLLSNSTSDILDLKARIEVMSRIERYKAVAADG
jgi:hypothetical protein